MKIYENKFKISSENYMIVYNKNKEDIKKEIINKSLSIQNSKIDTIILTMSGHGFFNDRDHISGFYSYDENTNTIEEVLISDIINTSVFNNDKYKNFYTFMSGCQVYSLNTLNTESIYYDNTMLIYPAIKGNVATGNIETGSDFLKAIFDLFFTEEYFNYIADKINTESLNIIDFLFIIQNFCKLYTVSISKKIKEFENYIAKNSDDNTKKQALDLINIHKNMIPQIYTNSNIRIHYKEIILKIYNYTKQEYDNHNFAISFLEDIGQKNIKIRDFYKKLNNLINIKILESKQLLEISKVIMIRQKMILLIDRFFIDIPNKKMFTDKNIQENINNLKKSIEKYDELYLPFDMPIQIPVQLLLDIIMENYDELYENYNFIMKIQPSLTLSKDQSLISKKYKLIKFKYIN
jgi:hypothetical protein